jgi:uncharacterized membrane protein
MVKRKHRNPIRFWMIILIILFLSSMSYANEPIPDTQTMRARVLAVEEIPGVIDMFETFLVTLEIYTGPMAGEIVTVENHLSDNPVYDVPVSPGDRVLLIHEMTSDGIGELYISSFIRDIPMLWILAAFMAFLILIGRWKGVKTILTLGLTFFMILRVLLPGMLRGYPPIIMTVSVSLVITLITIFLINGINTKSFSAVIGIFGGLLAAGFVMFIAGSQIKLTGLSSEEAVMLMYIPQNVTFEFRDLLFAGIIMGALGAVMDVGISIASSMSEIHRINPEVSPRQLMNSGMNVGRDIMTTMSNTLILAYTGAALPLLLLFMAYETSLIEIMNMDLIATEIVRALSGSIGLVLTIPLTVLVSSLLLTRKKHKRQTDLS